MVDKKNQSHEEALEENESEAVAASGDAVENSAQWAAEIEALNKKLADAEAKTTEYKDSWLRSQAEFQNYRKRVERDSELTYVSLKGDIAKKILPVLDDLERALQNRPAENPWASGIELVVRKFQNILESEGIKKIEAVGTEFDPNLHEAISHEPADGVQSGHVIDVVQNGYRIGERVIRPALVRVAQ
jgi:molecular chaperone GrpE